MADLECQRDGVATRLTCTGCDSPICPKCFVRTPVGFKCRTCVGVAPGGRARRPAPRRTVGVVAVVAAAGLAVLGWALLRPGDEPLVDESARYSGLSQRDIERPFLGEPGREGALTFTATGFECGPAGVDGAVRGRVPQGRFCTLVLRVQNTGAQPETFLAGSQFLVDSESRRYRADDDPELASRVVNPGNELTATLVFDVPPAVTPDEAELHRLERSQGVRMLLRPR